MVLNRASGEALWHQIEAEIAAEINGGDWIAGAQLPSEALLTKRFGVSRFVVRQAISGLERRGLVRVEQGRGTFVCGRVLTYALSARTRFSQNLIEQGFDPTGKVLFQKVVPAGPEVAVQLEVPEYQTVLHRRAIGLANDVPIELADSFVPMNRFPDFARVREQHPTFTAAFLHYGIQDYSRKSTRIEARMPDAWEAELLNHSKSEPVFVVSRVDVDNLGVPILFGCSVWSSERVSFTFSSG